MTLESLKEKLVKLGASPQRRLGQNFLIDESIIDRIVQASEKLPNKEVIEIGPGLGALTEKMLETGMQPKLIELDPQFAEYWRQRGLNVYNEDALHFDWSSVPEGSTLVSNLPYQISSSLVILACEKTIPCDNLVLMFQKEVAQRILAKPGRRDYGFLSVMAQIFFDIEKLLDASPRCFYPAPKVASRVLKFQRSDSELNPSAFKGFVKKAFSHPRKKLKNNLGAKLIEVCESQKSFEKFPDLRPQDLSKEDYQQLFEAWGRQWG